MRLCSSQEIFVKHEQKCRKCVCCLSNRGSLHVVSDSLREINRFPFTHAAVHETLGQVISSGQTADEDCA